MLALSQLEPSRLLRRAGAPPPLLGKDIANLPTSQDPNSPDRLGPGAGLGFFFFFLLYQDLAEIGCDLGERVMFVQWFVNANCYVSAQGYSGGSAGRASPRAHVHGALPACSPVPLAGSRARASLCVCGSFVTVLALYRGAQRVRACA